MAKLVQVAVWPSSTEHDAPTRNAEQNLEPGRLTEQKLRGPMPPPSTEQTVGVPMLEWALQVSRALSAAPVPLSAEHFWLAPPARM